jgi:hypothetical protein
VLATAHFGAIATVDTSAPSFNTFTSAPLTHYKRLPRRRLAPLCALKREFCSRPETGSAFPHRGPFHLHKIHDEFKKRIRRGYQYSARMLHPDFLDFCSRIPKGYQGRSPWLVRADDRAHSAPLRACSPPGSSATSHSLFRQCGCGRISCDTARRLRRPLPGFPPTFP